MALAAGGFLTGGTDPGAGWLAELARRHRLSPMQRQVVQRMLGMFPEVAFLSTVEIAERAGVSQPTVTRLAPALGFTGFPEFRAGLREAVLAGRTGAADPGQAGANTATAGPGRTAPVQPRPPSAECLDAIEQERANLAAAGRVAGGDRMTEAVRLLAATTPLGVLGLRASAALADYFGYFARRVLPAVTVHTDAGTVDDAVVELRGQGATAVLVFAVPRYPAATVAALGHARQLGLRTVVVADRARVPFDADVLLVAPVGTGLVFDSHAAVVVLAMSLLDGIAGTDPARTRRQLEAHEAVADRWAYEP